MTKAIIFDLDSCLSAADDPGQQLFASAFEAITHANQGSHSPSVLQNAFTDMWRLPFDFVAKKYGLTPAMKSAGWDVLIHSPRSPSVPTSASAPSRRCVPAFRVHLPRRITSKPSTDSNRCST